jgi:hypothetical protein
MHIHSCIPICDDDNRCVLAMITLVNRERKRVIDFLRKRKFEEGEMRHTLQF